MFLVVECGCRLCAGTSKHGSKCTGKCYCWGVVAIWQSQVSPLINIILKHFINLFVCKVVKLIWICIALGTWCYVFSLHSIWRFVPSSVYQSLVIVLVLSRLDYGNATLAGLPPSLLNRLQSVINAAARSIADLRRSEHITVAVASFHWLRVPKRIKFQLAVLVYRALHGPARQYLSGQLQYVADLPSRHRGRLRSSTSSLLLLSAIIRLQLPAHDSETVFLSTSSLPCHSQHFVRNWKLIYFDNHIQPLFFKCFAIVVLEVSFT